MLSRFCVTSNKLLLSTPPRGQSSQFQASPSLLFCDVSAAPDPVAQLLRETTSSCGFSSITWSWLSHFTYERPPSPDARALADSPSKRQCGPRLQPRTSLLQLVTARSTAPVTHMRKASKSLFLVLTSSLISISNYPLSTWTFLSNMHV